MEKLIKKHIGALKQQPMLSSVEHFVETGEITGGFLMAIKAMLSEHERNIVKNVSSNSVLADELPPDVTELLDRGLSATKVLQNMLKVANLSMGEEAATNLINDLNEKLGR